jgi:integrase
MSATIHKLPTTRAIAKPKSLTLAAINAIPAPASGNRVHYLSGAIVQGAEVPKGFGVRVTAAGNRSFVLSYRSGGKDRRLTIGEVGTWSVPDAVREARRLRREIDRGVDPLAAQTPKQKVRTVADMITDYVAHGLSDLRRPDQPTDALTRLLVPEIGRIPLLELRRSDLMPALDRIGAAVAAAGRGSGKTTMARVLTYFKTAWTWEMRRNDDLPNIFVRNMIRAEVERPGRALSDDEIRRLWAVWEGPFGDVLKVLLLTGQRRAEVSAMEWAEVSADGRLWTIPASRYKTGREHQVPLAEAVCAILAAQKRVGSTVFRTDRGSPINRGGYYVTKINKNLGVPPINWVIHDLRRTARSLMARLGIPEEIGERVVGHSRGKMESIYNRHDYLTEKRDALDKLAAEILRIVRV